jgi:hypothetical protein
MFTIRECNVDIFVETETRWSYFEFPSMWKKHVLYEGRQGGEILYNGSVCEQGR